MQFLKKSGNRVILFRNLYYEESEGELFSELSGIARSRRRKHSGFSVREIPAFQLRLSRSAAMIRGKALSYYPMNREEEVHLLLRLSTI